MDDDFGKIIKCVEFAKQYCEEHGFPPGSQSVRPADYQLIKRRFGGWPQFLEYCGLPPHPKTPTKKWLKEETTRLAEELGRTPTKKEFVSQGLTATNELKHWNKILKESDLQVNRVTGTSKEELVERMLALANFLKRTPTRAEFNQQAKVQNLCTAIVVQRYWGTWTNFVLTCGLVPAGTSMRKKPIVGKTDNGDRASKVSEERQPLKKLSKYAQQRLDESEKALINFCKENLWPSHKKWNEYAKEHGLLAHQTICEYLGISWEEYREKLGFQPHTRHYTAEECITALREAAKEYGPLFSRREYEHWQSTQPETPTYSIMCRRFGSWNKAKIAAELITNPAWGREFTDNELIEAVKNCAKALGDLFSESEYMAWRDNDLEIPHIETIRQRFKSLPEAKRNVGLQSYDMGAQYLYDNDRWKDPLIAFIAEKLSAGEYEKWLKLNEGPSVDTLWQIAGGYGKALVECLEVYIEMKRRNLKN